MYILYYAVCDCVPITCIIILLPLQDIIQISNNIIIHIGKSNTFSYLVRVVLPRRASHSNIIIIKC